MSKKDEYEIKWLGYNASPNYNRVWGHLVMKDDRNYVFWGVRGKKLQFKKHLNIYRIDSLIEQQKNKGYKIIVPEHFAIIEPNFINDLEIWLTTAILSDDFR